MDKTQEGLKWKECLDKMLMKKLLKFRLLVKEALSKKKKKLFTKEKNC